MISVTVTRKDDSIREITVSGHAGYATHGKDVVCAAVSSIAQTALLGLMRYEDKVEYQREEDGYLRQAQRRWKSRSNSSWTTAIPRLSAG